MEWNSTGAVPRFAIRRANQRIELLRAKLAEAEPYHRRGEFAADGRLESQRIGHVHQINQAHAPAHNLFLSRASQLLPSSPCRPLCERRTLSAVLLKRA